MKRIIKFSLIWILLILVCYFCFILWAAPLEIQIRQQVVGIGTTAAKIPASALRGREFIVIKNIDSSKTIYIGSSTVTADEETTGGDQLLPSERVYLEFSSDIDIYGIVAADTAKISILEGK